MLNYKDIILSFTALSFLSCDNTLKSLNIQENEYTLDIIFLGEYQLYLIECVENINNFMSA